MKTVTIYTDGACSGNPGPGGWGAILQYGKAEKELSGSEPSTTNNRMELLGVITALETLKEPCSVDLYSDSKYVVDGITKGWAKGWRARGWVKSDKKPAKNPELWGRLLDLLDKHEVRFHWVKGHADKSKTTPKARRSRSVSTLAASSAESTDVTTPAGTQHLTASLSMSPFLRCEISAAGAHERKYSRLMPPA